ncbi:Zea mays Retrotransposon Opie-2 [Phytophthora cinnamomi]|uniref:Zea mays Retrotransposon Opie-2 n=1 Tax=Phytophthora cinnamomi TaxID=4785 RepID=UPI003559BE72|nr:Zea mays Retrotransposon Opie-2 [Phytophthora cinnamomi]
MVVSTRGSVAAAAANGGSQANPAPPAARASTSQAPVPTPPPAQATQAASQAPVPALPPAQTAQAPASATALDPALTSPAAAFGANRDGGGSQHSQPQPEQEPNHDDESDSGAGEINNAVRGKRSDKIDLRNIKVERFDGSVATGNFDAKAREFCEELDEQIDDAQALAGQVWREDVKKAVFKLYLTGMARRWYRDWRTANPAASYSDGANALMYEFRPVLLGVDIAERIKKEMKRWNETYRELADRLLQMADALEGGKAVPANARHALVAFVRNAYPKFTDFLETKVVLKTKPEDQLKVAVAALARKAETDGRLPDRRKTKVAPPAATAPKSKSAKPASKKPQQTIAKNAKNPKKRPAEAQAAVVERKKKPKTTNTNTKSSFKCYECGATGHTADFCRTYLQGNKNGEFDKGTALNAEAKEESENDEDDQ